MPDPGRRPTPDELYRGPRFVVLAAYVRDVEGAVGRILPALTDEDRKELLGLAGSLAECAARVRELAGG